MFSKFSFYIWGAIVSQLLSAAFHSIGFFVTPEPENDSERQLFNLMDNYKMDLGAGFSRSFADLFLSLSICFTLICTLGAVVNWYMKRKSIPADIWGGLLLIELVVFGILPIVCTGAIFFFLLGAYLTNKPTRQRINAL
jgi:hypothetical protein